jgi:hypothetical protein
MNNTNPIYQEFIVRLQQRNLEAETRHNRLLNEASQISHAENSGWVAHRIAHLAEWMIVTGESLRQHYNHTEMHNCAPPTNALAH